MTTNSKPVWVGRFPIAPQTEPTLESNALRVARLVLVERYRNINGCNPSGLALSEMHTLAKAVAAGLDYVHDEKLLRKFLRKRVTKLVNEWNLADWKRKRKGRGGKTTEVSYGAALGWKIDREKAAEYNTQMGARKEAERIDDLKYHLLQLLPEGNDKQRYEVLIDDLDALDFDSAGSIAIGSHTTLRQTAKDLSERGIKTDDKAVARLIDKLRKLAKAQITKARPRINKSVINKSYGVIKTSVEEATKKLMADVTDKPLFTLATGDYQPGIRFPRGADEPLVEVPLPYGRIGKHVEGFRDHQPTRGRDVGANAQALEQELERLVESSGALKREAALVLSTWRRFHHHLPENCPDCRLRVERIRRLSSGCGRNFEADTSVTPLVAAEGQSEAGREAT